MDLSDAKCCASQSTVPGRGCPHLKEHKEAISQNYKSVVNYIKSYKSNTSDRAKVPIPKCHICGFKSGGSRFLYCLHCVFIGCWQGKHIREHFDKTKHVFAVDGTVSEIYCHLCKDYVYDVDFDIIPQVEYDKHASKRRKVLDPTTNATSAVWQPTSDELDELKTASKRLVISNQSVGLRGLYNMGNTCFMNCILQTFAHLPELRDYFLSDKHNPLTCAITKNKRDQFCLGCEMDAIFTTMFSGATTPFSPHHFMYSIWKYSLNLAGYDQQDAHEFLMSCLDGIHSHCEGSTIDCQCIIHRLFSGSMRSDLTCKHCNNKSTTYEPFLDVSLDFPKLKKRKKADEDDSEAGMTTLWDCLNKFTQAESLGSDQKIKCTNCNSYQESIKQMSLKSLPRILTFHVKRFKQINGASQKIDTFVEFPEELNMSPYMTSSLLKSANETDEEKVEGYQLCAVVNHIGNIDNGHYTCYIRHGDRWYWADDNYIVQVPVESALRSEGYLLFYMKTDE
jgi:ubiquitin carboxyl-terminal hydrolase 22/27/51